MTEQDARAVLEANPGVFAPDLLPSVFWKMTGGMLVVFHPMSDTTWMVHQAAAPGTHGMAVWRGIQAADAAFRAAHPEVRKLVGFVREGNARALRMSYRAGFRLEGKIDDYHYENGEFSGILIVGRRQ